MIGCFFFAIFFLVCTAMVVALVEVAVVFCGVIDFNCGLLGYEDCVGLLVSLLLVYRF